MPEPLQPAPARRRLGRVRTYRGAALASLLFPLTGIPALIFSLRARRLAARGEVEEARASGQRARDLAWISLGLGLTLYLVGAIVWLTLARDHAVLDTFFLGKKLFSVPAWRSLLKGFWINVQVFLIAEIIVLGWALVVAIIRLLPGRASAPLRWLATVYVDVFRGIPSVLVIMLVGFGLSQAKVPVVGDLSDMQYAILALTLTYGAYVSEVFRSGIESVHWSQSAAARSLGLSYAETMRHVVVPQAVRRIGPPLLNDFIGLQKDTSLIQALGLLDVMKRASQVNTTAPLSLTGNMMAALLFLVVTIPFTRYLDYILRKQKLKTQAAQ